MNTGHLSIEFYVGRFIYLSDLLESLPAIHFTTMGEHDAVSFYVVDRKTGKSVRRRVTDKNSQWDKYRAMAARRERAEEQMKKLLALWKEDHHGSLKHIAEGYVLKPDTNSNFNSEFWESLKGSANTIPKGREYVYKGITMRSVFETEVAQVLDRIGIDYKYDTLIRANYKDIISPDFSMNLPEFNRCGFSEAMGGLGNLNYINDNVDKYRKYLNMGLYPNRDVALIPADNQYRPDPDSIMRFLGVTLDAIARQCVYKKT